MSAEQDFENAPAGAIATNDKGRKAVKTFDTDNLPWYGDDLVWRSAEHMCWHHFTLDPTAPTTAQEALDLAWELAHPVKEGQTIPRGARHLIRSETRFHTRALNGPHEVSPWDEVNVRTLDPLPEPEPDWIDAPAVLARAKGYPVLFTWIPVDGPQHHRWHSPVKGQGETYDWQDLTDVTPLWPKEDA